MTTEHLRIGNIVGAHIVDTHAVAGRDELVVLAKQRSLVEQRRGHQVRAAQDGERDARVAVSVRQEIIASSVELHKRHVLAVELGGFQVVTRLAKEAQLDEVLNLLLLARTKKERKGIGPALDMRNGTEDRLDTVDSRLVIFRVVPVEAVGMVRHRMEEEWIAC